MRRPPKTPDAAGQPSLTPNPGDTGGTVDTTADDGTSDGDATGDGTTATATKPWFAHEGIGRSVKTFKARVQAELKSGKPDRRVLSLSETVERQLQKKVDDRAQSQHQREMSYEKGQAAAAGDASGLKEENQFLRSQLAL